MLETNHPTMSAEEVVASYRQPALQAIGRRWQGRATVIESIREALGIKLTTPSSTSPTTLPPEPSAELGCRAAPSSN
ncbi:MAG: hypothetical protein ACREQM_03780 [Candidatus Dormibacteraceae bacterium]